jgi:hypothetical protein
MLITDLRQKYFILSEYFDYSFLLIERIVTFVSIYGGQTRKKKKESTEETEIQVSFSHN